MRRRRKFPPKYDISRRNQNSPQLNCSIPRAAHNSLPSLFCLNCICKTNICYPQFAHGMQHFFEPTADVPPCLLGRRAQSYFGPGRRVTPHHSITKLPSVMLAIVLSCFFVGCCDTTPQRNPLIAIVRLGLLDFYAAAST